MSDFRLSNNKGSANMYRNSSLSTYEGQIDERLEHFLFCTPKKPYKIEIVRLEDGLNGR